LKKLREWCEILVYEGKENHEKFLYQKTYDLVDNQSENLHDRRHLGYANKQIRPSDWSRAEIVQFSCNLIDMTDMSAYYY